MGSGGGFEARARRSRDRGAMEGREFGGGGAGLVLGGVEGISPSSSSSRLEGDSSDAGFQLPKLDSDSLGFDGNSGWLAGNSFNAVVDSLGFKPGSGRLVANSSNAAFELLKLSLTLLDSRSVQAGWLEIGSSRRRPRSGWGLLHFRWRPVPSYRMLAFVGWWQTRLSYQFHDRGLVE